MPSNFERIDPSRSLKYDARTVRPRGRRVTVPETQMAVRIPRDLHRRLRLYTTQQETTIKDFTREAIIEKMAGDLK